MSASPDRLLTERLLTLDEFERLPEDHSSWYELWEGVLYSVRKAASLQRRVVSGLIGTLNEQIPRGWRALSDVEILLDERWPPTVCHADVVLTSIAAIDRHRNRLPADDVLAVVEVVAPGTTDSARIPKRLLHAKAGIPAYWVLEIRDRLTLAESRLVRGDYETYFQDRGMFYTRHPFELMVDIDSLVRRR